MKINKKNYLAEAKKVDFSKLPAKFKEGHSFAERAIKAEKSGSNLGPSINEALDAYFSNFQMEVTKLGIADEIKKTEDWLKAEELKKRTALTALKMKHKAAEDMGKKKPEKDRETYSATDYLKDYRASSQGDPYGKGKKFNVKIYNEETNLYSKFTIWGESEKAIRSDLGALLSDAEAIEYINPVKTPATSKKPASNRTSKRSGYSGSGKSKKPTEAQKKAAQKALKDIEKKTSGDIRKWSVEEVLETAQRFNENRSLLAQMKDNSSDNKKRLTPTPENLRRWMNEPGRFDLIGIDTFEKNNPTANLKIKREIFWKRLGFKK
jgi:hypothetical protein